jgi:tRNA pseudouridine38-40 synthase
MARYFIEFAFKGTPYHGWQSQPNALTVQAELEKALEILTGEQIATTGAGRTDTGVHARSFTAHFDTEHPFAANYSDFIYKMNAILPLEIALSNIFRVKPDAHARYSALSRTYKYTISQVKDPFYNEFSWYYSLPLDLDSMNKGACMITETKDFTSFSKLHSDVKNNNCHVTEAIWNIDANRRLIFTIRANRFLRNMVRSIVGTMIEIGRGKINLMELKEIIDGKDRRLAGFSVPAHGLELFAIEYIDGIKI